MSACLQRTQNHLRVAEHRKNQNLAVRLRASQLPQYAEAVDVFHADVEKNDVGLKSLREARQLASRRRFRQ